MQVILSHSLFLGTDDQPVDGFVAWEGNRIVAVGSRAEAKPWLSQATQVIDAGERTVMAGLSDDHTFFSGWVLEVIGADLSGVADAADALAVLDAWADGREPGSLVLGHGASPELTAQLGDALTAHYPDRPAVVFAEGRGTCALNDVARERYGFTPDECYSEMLWAMMGEYLAFPETRDAYKTYMQMLSERGVTSIKEMSFDDYYGFVDVMEDMAKSGELTVRVSLQSQPVGAGINLEHGRAMRERLSSPYLSFTGYNRMTDRGIGGEMGELTQPYKSNPETCCVVPPDWELIESELAAADAEGFRYTLHCQGDGAVRHTIDLYEKCARDADGKLQNRHAITDLEFSQPEDLARFGAMGGICEIYPQIQTLDKRQDILDMVDERLGMERFVNYWNRRAMIDGGCTVACGTDLPLLLPHLGESIWSAVGGLFDDGLAANQQNMLTLPELLRAWTLGSARSAYADDVLGTLEVGKLADLIVLDRDVFATDPASCRDLAVDMTVSDGRVVWERA